MQKDATTPKNATVCTGLHGTLSYLIGTFAKLCSPFSPSLPVSKGPFAYVIRYSSNVGEFSPFLPTRAFLDMSHRRKVIVTASDARLSIIKTEFIMYFTF